MFPGPRTTVNCICRKFAYTTVCSESFNLIILYHILFIPSFIVNINHESCNLNVCMDELNNVKILKSQKMKYQTVLCF